MKRIDENTPERINENYTVKRIDEIRERLERYRRPTVYTPLEVYTALQAASHAYSDCSELGSSDVAFLLDALSVAMEALKDIDGELAYSSGAVDSAQNMIKKALAKIERMGSE